MSFIEKYVVRRDSRHLYLSIMVYFLAGATTVVLAVVDSDVVERAKTVAGLNPSELLALVALGSLAFAAWIIKGINTNLEKLVKLLHDRPCFYKVKEKEKEDE